MPILRQTPPTASSQGNGKAWPVRRRISAPQRRAFGIQEDKSCLIAKLRGSIISPENAWRNFAPEPDIHPESRNPTRSLRGRLRKNTYRWGLPVSSLVRFSRAPETGHGVPSLRRGGECPRTREASWRHPDDGISTELKDGFQFLPENAQVFRPLHETERQVD